jgi:hypothetical protein
VGKKGIREGGREGGRILSFFFIAQSHQFLRPIDFSPGHPSLSITTYVLGCSLKP